MVQAMIDAWIVICLVTGCSAMLAWCLELWVKSARRWGLIRNAYAQGYRDGIAKRDPRKED